MEIVRQPQDPRLSRFNEWHKLVPAEAGFSVLTAHAEHHGVDREAVEVFAAEVNSKRQVSSLHPQAPISAVPVRYLRDSNPVVAHVAVEELRKDFRLFLQLNATTLHASDLIVDLHVSPAPVPERFIIAVVEELRDQGDEAGLARVLIFS